jgi:hypothetical protein
MAAKARTAPTPTLAHYADKAITPVMVDFIAFIESETGYKVDPMSVQLGSLLRGTFQKSEGNQKRIAEAAQKRAAEETAKAEPAPAPKPRRTRKATA